MFEKRLTIFLFVLIAMTVALVARAFSIQVVNQDYWAASANDSLRRTDLLPTGRGKILDRTGKVLAADRPCIDACVDYRAIMPEPDATWLTAVAVERLKSRSDEYENAPRAQRKELLAAAKSQIKIDIAEMWSALAKAGGKSEAQMAELRKDLIRRVETRRRIAWYRKYEKAVAAYEQRPPAPWYQQWLTADDGSGPKLEDFDIRVADETEAHVVLPNIDFALRNALQSRIERYPGLVLRTSVTRVYPYNNAACHVIGYLGKVTREDLAGQADEVQELKAYDASDSIGRAGLESLLEDDLRGARGRREASRLGHEISRVEAVPGGDVKTTIDIELQQEIEAAFKRVTFMIDSTLPPQTLSMPGAAVVIDIASGEVISLASYPTYDVNLFDKNYAALTANVIDRPLTNRATMSALEPGSTVKPIVGLGAITQGLAGVDEGIVCDGYLHIDGKQKRYGRCWTMSIFSKTHLTLNNPPPSAALTYAEALERSCNVYFETLADRLRIDGVSRWFDAFGLGRPTGIGIAEKSGRIPSDWTGPSRQARGVAWAAGMGQQQIAATPVQMANVAATIARDGIWVRPTLVPRDQNLIDPRRARAATSPTQPFVDVVDLHLDPAAVRDAKLGMFNVVNSPAGTGKAAKLDDIQIAGKTGSATSAPLKLPRRDASGKTLLDPKGRVIYDPVVLGTTLHPNPAAPWYRAIGLAEDKAASHAWFIGFAPAHNPKIAFAVLVEYGGGGGPAAGGVAKTIVEACARRGYLAEK